MKHQHRLLTLGLVFALFSVAASQCEKPGKKYVDLGSRRLITILQTNDMHGGIAGSTNPVGQFSGGMAMLGGVVRAIRQGLHDQYHGKADILVVDSGDQYQGSLLSNINEGELVYSLMNEIGYDAAVPGNHGYDFGPVGWLEDTVTTADQDPRGVIKKLSEHARFFLLSANTYLKSSIQDTEGNSLPVSNVGCKPAKVGTAGKVIDWNQARQPKFVSPYVIKDIAGVRVAVIGIDSTHTSETTSISNVQDLCFADEVETYLRIRAEIEGKADVFVMLLHDGNSPREREGGAIQIAQQLGMPGQPPLVDAIIAGHTHAIQEEVVNQIPIIQSGSGTRFFGRLDLYWDVEAKALDRTQTRVRGGLELLHDGCPKGGLAFCEVSTKNQIQYEGRLARPDPVIEAMIRKATDAVDPVAGRELGIAQNKLWVDRIKESPLANMMTDSLREYSQAEIAFMNTGGLRQALGEGVFSYWQLFNVLPFNNRGVVLGPLTAEKLFALLLRSARTCGQYGALMQSGLKVEIEKNCEKNVGVDHAAKLLHVETLAGEVLLDLKSGIRADAARTFTVATLDFLASGGSGYVEFQGTSLITDLGIVRELMTEQLLSSVVSTGALKKFSGATDGRWKEVRPTADILRR
ncbi:MAG TPA: hypothetical protein DCS07_06315 [Bdellovibrionales bacterium]|nr:MAG: hypothetical protein A2X97_14665 [Bdellovibrionales bacterium GWA1_52_35]OFZ35245.1 MAG: hypothetical protein A2070_04985 [Bdellovibrionales bacterium GWC1_52_8]HAR42230.1 hypothetical protein [Bdellovibrionales bacterium]HCM39873.1 hypothetical protein [Bdellovibrionales bacterium]